MAWLSNANTIASLVLAIFGIGGYLFGVVTYLKNKATPPKQDTSGGSQTSQYIPQKTVYYKPLTWIDWIELFAQAFVDTEEFILTLLFDNKLDHDLDTTISRIGFCLFICGFGVVAGEVIIGLAIGIFLSLLGVGNPTGAAVGVATILLFMTFSLVYIYHVGLLAEERQKEQMEEVQSQQSAKR